MADIIVLNQYKMRIIAQGRLLMISDILFEACEEIERYLTDMPDVYADTRQEIEALCAAMRRLKAKLDNPFFTEVHP